MLKEDKYVKTIEKQITFNYVCYTPEDYDGSKPYPLVVFLHGAGERGDDISLLYKHGFLKHVKEGKNYPFIIVAPQCPFEKYWGNYTESLNVFLDSIIEEYNVDVDRIYLTGLSMGGTGTWHWLLASPERFAAGVPICGTGVYWNAYKVRTLPLWVFHGNKDTIVPIRESEAMVESLNNIDGNVKFTVLDGVGHNAWEYAYNDELVEWLLQQKRK